MDRDVQQLRKIVLGHETVRQAANHSQTNLQARAEDIDTMAYFTSDRYNGRVLPLEKYKAPAKLPPVGVFKFFSQR